MMIGGYGGGSIKSISVRVVSNGFIVVAMVPYSETPDATTDALRRMAIATESVVSQRYGGGEVQAEFLDGPQSGPVALREETIVVTDAAALVKVVETYVKLGVLVAPTTTPKAAGN